MSPPADSEPVVAGLLLRGRYYDSVQLLVATSSMKSMAGIADAAVVMATEANQALLAEQGLAFAALREGGPTDVAVAVRGAPDAVADALLGLDELLATHNENRATITHGSLGAALLDVAAAVPVMVAVPGGHAAREALDSVRAGHPTIVFSDNVSLDEERQLKTEGVRHGAPVLGPDCGTVLMGGVGFGFANSLAPGPVAIVAASGSGSQALACALSERGIGVRTILGVGGRDLTDAVGGTSFFGGLELLEDDSATGCVVIIAKAIGAGVLCELVEVLAQMTTPTVACLLGTESGIVEPVGAIGAGSIEAAARGAAAILQGHDHQSELDPLLAAPPHRPHARAEVVGLFAGGTLAKQALRALREFRPDTLSNLDSRDVPAAGDRILDLGDDALTIGRPHPMIDPSSQADMLVAAAADPGDRVVLFDVVLGHGSHSDPAAVLGPACREARQRAQQNGRTLSLYASVVGTAEDPQGLPRQLQALTAAGARPTRSPAAAVVAAVLAATPTAPGTSKRQAYPPGFLERPREVVCVGARWFADSLRSQDVEVHEVRWRPPLAADQRTESVLGRLL